MTPLRRAAFAALTIATLALVGTREAHAQRPAVTVRMAVDANQLAVGEPFRLRVEVTSEGASVEDVQLPDLSGFDVAARSTSQPMEFGFGPNGRPIMRTSVIQELTLVPRSGGAFTLRAARARVGGRTYESDPMVLKVLGEPAPSNEPESLTPGSGPDAPHVDANFDPQAFIAVATDRRTAYVGQPVLVTYYLYERVNGRPMLTHGTSADAFWVHDLLTPQMESQASVETVRHVQFRVHVIGRFVAFPLRAGELPITSPEVTIEPTFGAFGFGGALTRTAPRLAIDVKPLPPPVPPHVAVGRYEITAALDTDRARTGEAVTLTVTMRGDGSLRDVTPEVPALEGVRIDQPTAEDHLTVTRDVVSGERVLRYLLVPSRPGDLSIPPITVSTFDPDTSEYRTIATSPLALHVSGAPVASEAEAPDEHAPEATNEPRRTTIEFGPIRRESAFERVRVPLSRAPFFPFALSVPVFLFLAGLVIRSVGSTVAARNGARRDGPTPKKLLDEARTLAGKGEPRAFYSAVARALRTALEQRFGRALGSFTHPELRAYLASRGMPDDLVTRVVDELEGSDFARFSSVGAAPDEMQRCHERVTALVDRVARVVPNAEDAP